MFYTYWNDFIKKWFSGCKNIDGWTEPAGELSPLYIPEPWWGNDGSQPLHSIVVNFNPGKGGIPQTRKNLTKVFKSSYANDIVNNTTIQSGSKEWPNCTRNWHLKKRAIPILQHLGIDKSLIKIESHLSIELIPWHSENAVHKDYTDYLKENIQKIYEHSICFAAHEAERIENEKLKNVVLLKMSGNFTKFLLDLLKDAKCCEYSIIEEKRLHNAAFLTFTLCTFPNTCFVSIWGRNSRNNFPISHMQEILNNIARH